jgi:hypothetical protein
VIASARNESGLILWVNLPPRALVALGSIDGPQFAALDPLENAVNTDSQLPGNFGRALILFAAHEKSLLKIRSCLKRLTNLKEA